MERRVCCRSPESPATTPPPLNRPLYGLSLAPPSRSYSSKLNPSTPPFSQLLTAAQLTTPPLPRSCVTHLTRHPGLDPTLPPHHPPSHSPTPPQSPSFPLPYTPVYSFPPPRPAPSQPPLHPPPPQPNLTSPPPRPILLFPLPLDPSSQLPTLTYLPLSVFSHRPVQPPYSVLGRHSAQSRALRFPPLLLSYKRRFRRVVGSMAHVP